MELMCEMKTAASHYVGGGQWSGPGLGSNGWPTRPDRRKLSLPYRDDYW